jgi:hypothetical protein
MHLDRMDATCRAYLALGLCAGQGFKRRYFVNDEVSAGHY